LEAINDSKIDALDQKMDEIKEFISHTPNGGTNQSDNVFHGTHDEVKRDMNMTMEFHNPNHSSPNNHDHQDFNLGPQNYHISKINMRKFDGKDPITWIL